MQNDLLHSKFRPALLEYKIDKSEGEDRLIIDVNGRDKIILTGIIDRVDVFEDENGEKYVRIIDYKTGSLTLNIQCSTMALICRCSCILPLYLKPKIQ